MTLPVVQVFEISRWRLHVDVEATRRLYAERAEGAAEACERKGCLSCRNYILARDRLPEAVKTLLVELGEDLRKEFRVAHGTFLRPGWIAYRTSRTRRE